MGASNGSHECERSIHSPPSVTTPVGNDAALPAKVIQEAGAAVAAVEAVVAGNCDNPVVIGVRIPAGAYGVGACDYRILGGSVLKGHSAGAGREDGKCEERSGNDVGEGLHADG